MLAEQVLASMCTSVVITESSHKGEHFARVASWTNFIGLLLLLYKVGKIIVLLFAIASFRGRI